MSRVLLRPAEPSDADDLFRLLTQFAVSYKPAREAFDRHFPHLLETENADLLVASLDELRPAAGTSGAAKVIGYILAFRLLTLYANGPITEIQELMVDPEYRDRGVGRRLVETVVERAWGSGSVEVTVPTRRAGEYYVKLGFVETAGYFKRRRRC
jgi:N-acetylglutamate synthase-like GNAT family acetyltransferase